MNIECADTYKCRSLAVLAMLAKDIRKLGKDVKTLVGHAEAMRKSSGAAVNTGGNRMLVSVSIWTF